ncbi:MAG: PD-(D/E)XK nuclease family protein [Candidatus Latescibacteria bacterium]|nr:PD-(D/E)XK nuclease family protein [Candidatus Latescibacterota bacterium]
MALLPEGFRFSQGSLATGEWCLRRFYLRYLRRLSWPAAADDAGEAKERGAARGRLFHHLVHQHALGLEVEALVAASKDPELAEWWSNFKHHPPVGLPEGEVFSELELWVPLGPGWLTARFDRVVVGQGGRLCIVDWKTGRGLPAEYLASWQTLVYCFVLSEGGSLLRGGVPVEPAQISLCYWPAAFPDQVQWHRYDRTQHDQARERLERSAGFLAGLQTREEFCMTEDLKRCASCEFQSYCSRGAGVGAGWEFDEEEEEDWGLEL